MFNLLRRALQQDRDRQLTEAERRELERFQDHREGQVISEADYRALYGDQDDRL